MRKIKSFVKKVYRRKRNIWFLRRFLLFITVFISIYFLWAIYSKAFLLTPIEWKLLPVSFLLSLIPFFWGKPTIESTITFIENEIDELKGRLYLLMDPFPVPTDSEEYSRKAEHECSEILKEKREKNLVRYSLNYKLILPPAILIILILLGGLSIKKIRPKPRIKYIETPVKEDSKSLIVAYDKYLDRMNLIKNNKTEKMIQLGSGDFAILSKSVETDSIQVGYRVWRSEKVTLTVLPEMVLKNIRLKYFFPSYLNLEPMIDTAEKNTNHIPIRVIRGTRVKFRGITSTVPGGISGKLESREIRENEFGGIFLADENERIEVTLTDTLQFSSATLVFHVNTFEDNNPSIEFIYPEGSYKLDESMKVLLKIRSEDDYGLSKILILSEYNQVEIAELNGIRYLEDTLTVSMRDLLPGDTIKITACAVDIANNKSCTEPLIVYMPTMEELFADYRELSDTLKSSTTRLEEEEEKLRKKLEELLNSNRIDADDKYVIGKILEEQKRLLEDIERISELARKIQDPRIMKELENINKLLEQMNTGELLHQIQNVESSQDYSRKTLKEFNLNQEQLLEALKLGRKSLESLRDLIDLQNFMAKTEEIYRKQNEISLSEPGDSLSEEQLKLKSELENLISEMKSSTDKDIKSGTEELEKMDLTDKMNESAQLMKTGKMSRQLMENIKEGLRDFLRRLQEARARRTGQQIINKIKKKAWELSFVLRIYNKLIDDEPSVKKGLIQQGLSESIKRIKKDLEMIFIKSFAFSPEVLKNLTEINRRMQDLSREFINGQPLQSTTDKIKLLLSETTVILFESPPTSASSMLNQMQQIMKGQQSISSRMEQILPMPSPDRGKALRELAGKQRELANRVKEMGEVLKPLADELDEIAGKMESGEINKEIIERQKKVLDRLIEAEKSIRRKQTSRKRRSQPGIFVSPSSRIQIPEDMGEKNRELRELLKKRMEEPYPEVYEEEVKKYIRRLVD